MKSYRTYEMKNCVRAVRVACGLTQKQLAILCNTTQNTISSIETYQYEPSAYLAALLCDCLKVPFDKLFYYEYEGVKAPVYTRMDMSRSDLRKQHDRELHLYEEIDAEYERLTTMDPFFE